MEKRHNCEASQSHRSSGMNPAVLFLKIPPELGMLLSLLSPCLRGGTGPFLRHFATFSRHRLPMQGAETKPDMGAEAA